MVVTFFSYLVTEQSAAQTQLLRKVERHITAAVPRGDIIFCVSDQLSRAHDWSPEEHSFPEEYDPDEFTPPHPINHLLLEPTTFFPNSPLNACVFHVLQLVHLINEKTRIYCVANEEHFKLQTMLRDSGFTHEFDIPYTDVITENGIRPFPSKSSRKFVWRFNPVPQTFQGTKQSRTLMETYDILLKGLKNERYFNLPSMPSANEFQQKLIDEALRNPHFLRDIQNLIDKSKLPRSISHSRQSHSRENERAYYQPATRESSPKRTRRAITPEDQPPPRGFPGSAPTRRDDYDEYDRVQKEDKTRDAPRPRRKPTRAKRPLAARGRVPSSYHRSDHGGGASPRSPSGKMGRRRVSPSPRRSPERTQRGRKLRQRGGGRGSGNPVSRPTRQQSRSPSIPNASDDSSMTFDSEENVYVKHGTKTKRTKPKPPPGRKAQSARRGGARGRGKCRGTKRTTPARPKQKKEWYYVDVTGFYRDTTNEEFEAWLEDDKAVEFLRELDENADIFDWPPEFRGYGREGVGMFRIAIKEGTQSRSLKLASELYETLNGRRVHGHAVVAQAKNFEPLKVYY